jgi:hypothetical protein
LRIDAREKSNDSAGFSPRATKRLAARIEREEPPMYEVMLSDGNGPRRMVKFKLFRDALRYVHTYSGEGSFAIRKPNGAWHRWAPDQQVLRNQRRAPRFATRASCSVDPTPGRRSRASGVWEIQRSSVIDAGPGGACVLLDPRAAPVRRGDPVSMTVTSNGDPLTLAARVAWTGAGRVGLQFGIHDPEVGARYEHWLAEASVGGGA